MDKHICSLETTVYARINSAISHIEKIQDDLKQYYYHGEKEEQNCRKAHGAERG